MSETEARTARESIQWLNDELVKLEQQAADNVRKRKNLLFLMGLLSERVDGSGNGK